MASLINSSGASGTGSMTIQGPNTNSNQTITLPDATGTVMVSGNMPAFSAYQSSNQTGITSSVYTKVVIDTKEFDTANAFDNTTNYRFQPTVAGYYQINGCVCTNVVATTLLATIFKNGSNFKVGSQINASVGIGSHTPVSALVYLNGSTDYVELYAYITGASPSIISGLSNTYFQASMVRTS